MLHLLYKALLPQSLLYVVDHHFAISSLFLLVRLFVASVVDYLSLKVPFCLRSFLPSHCFLVVVRQAERTEMCALIIDLFSTLCGILLVLDHLLLDQDLFVTVLDVDLILALGLILHSAPL